MTIKRREWIFLSSAKQKTLSQCNSHLKVTWKGNNLYQIFAYILLAFCSLSSYADECTKFHVVTENNASTLQCIDENQADKVVSSVTYKIQLDSRFEKQFIGADNVDYPPTSVGYFYYNKFTIASSTSTPKKTRLGEL